MKIKQAILRFNTAENFHISFGHYLRGFFANSFSEVLFHNHIGDGKYRYGYPLIQYKIIDGKPTVVGLNEGANLICHYFLDIDKLILRDEVFTEFEKTLFVDEIEMVFESTLKYTYRFLTPWMALNQQNYNIYSEGEDKPNFDKNEFLQRLLVGNILSYAKATGCWLDSQVFVLPILKSIPVKFKNQQMIGFGGEFHSNLKLPELIGLGNSTARGFGTIRLIK